MEKLYPMEDIEPYYNETYTYPSNYTTISSPNAEEPYYKKVNEKYNGTYNDSEIFEEPEEPPMLGLHDGDEKRNITEEGHTMPSIDPVLPYDNMTMEPMPEEPYHKNSRKSMYHHHGKHKYRDMFRHPSIDISKMTVDEACDLARYVIGCIVGFIFVYVSIIVLICQGIYVCIIHKIRKAQLKLERLYMPS